MSGGAGFIGSHVAGLLLQEGYQVEILDDLSSGRRENLPRGAAFHHGDIGSEEAARLVREGRFDVLFHLAAQIDVRKSVLEPVADARINVLGSLNLLEAVRSGGHATRVVFSSTGGALYGDFVPIPSVETMPKDPESPYGVAKLSIELYMGYFGRVHGVETVALRYSNVYGPRQDPHGEAGVVAIFCNRLLQGQPLTVFGDGQQTRDYVFAGDVARANLAAATMKLPAARQFDERAFNIGTGRETSVLELAATLQRAAGTSVPVQHLPARAGELPRSAVSNEKAVASLGWRPQVNLEEGLRMTYEYFSNRARGR